MRLLISILLIGLMVKAEAQNSSFRPTYNYEGYIKTSTGKNIPIKLNFLVLLDSTVMGSYYYNPQNGSLKLSGKYSTDNTIVFFEWDDKGRNNGRFDGQVLNNRHTIRGTWKSADKKREFTFTLSLANGMRSYWDYIKKYRSLKEYHNIDSALKHASDVISVDFAGQQLNKLPAQFGKLPNVISTNILGNNFTTFPTVLTQLSQLEEVSCASNNMHYIGPQIGRLKNLRILILDFNSFSKLPIQIGQLSDLLYLDVSMNRNLHTLPSSIANLKKLQELHIEKTSIDITELARIKKLLPNCVVIAN